MLRLSLENLLFEQRTQQWVLRAVADDLDNLNNEKLRDWFGNELDPPQPSKKRPIQWSMPDVISADRRQSAEPDTVDLGEVTALLRETAESGSGLKCTFCVCLCLLLCDNLITFTAAGSPAGVCEAYFAGFEQRIVEGLCGRMGYSNDRSGRVLVPAKPPCEIAILELELAKHLFTAHNARGAALGRAR